MVIMMKLRMKILTVTKTIIRGFFFSFILKIVFDFVIIVNS